MTTMDTGAAPASTSTPGTQAPATTSTAPSGTQDWTTGFNDDFKGYVQNKGFKDPASVVESYRNLEKLMGAPKERLLKLPEKEDAPEWDEIYQRLGRPEKPEEYRIAGDGEPTEFGKAASSWFHEAGLSRKQAEKLAQKWNEYSATEQKAQIEALDAKFKESDTVLKKEWGAAFEQNMTLAERAANTLGFTKEQREALAKSMGPADAVKFIHSLAVKLGGEDKFVAGDSKGGQFGALNPEAARNRIQSLRGDTDFIRRLTAGDTNAKTEWDKLHQYAYPS